MSVSQYRDSLNIKECLCHFQFYKILFVSYVFPAVKSVSKVFRHRYHYSKGIGEEEHRQLKTRKVGKTFEHVGRTSGDCVWD